MRPRRRRDRRRTTRDGGRTAGGLAWPDRSLRHARLTGGRLRGDLRSGLGGGGRSQTGSYRGPRTGWSAGLVSRRWALLDRLRGGRRGLLPDRRSTWTLLRVIGLPTKPQTRPNGLLGRRRWGRIPYGYGARGLLCLGRPWGGWRLSTRLRRRGSARSLAAGLRLRSWLSRRRLPLLGRLHRRLLLLGRPRARRPTRTPGVRLRAGGIPGGLRAPALPSRSSASGGAHRCGRSRLPTGVFALPVRARGLLALGLRGGQIVGSAGGGRVLRTVASGLIPRTRSIRALRARRTGALRHTLPPVPSHLDVVGGAVTWRSLGGGSFRVAFTHCHPPGPPHHQIPHSGSRAILPVLTRAKNRPRPRPRSNWNHHPQEPHLQVVPLLLLSRG